jgi:uncharacterized membrane protein YdbT with pleckstrin-like domain
MCKPAAPCKGRPRRGIGFRAAPADVLYPSVIVKEGRPPMSYVRKVLLPGEQVIYETGLHWLVYGRALVLFCVAVALSVGAQYVPSPDTRRLVLGVAGVALVLAVIAAATAAIRRLSTELAVTDQRLIFKRGVFARHTIEMNRTKVESVDVDQSVLGRILGYGTLMVRGTGGSLEPMEAISDPLSFRTHITAEPIRHTAQQS